MASRLRVTQPRRPKALHSVQELAQQYTEQAIETLAEIMRDKDAPATARLAAAEALLNRGWGKPIQPSAQSESGTFEDWLDSLDDHTKQLIADDLNRRPDIDDDPAGAPPKTNARRRLPASYWS